MIFSGFRKFLSLKAISKKKDFKGFRSFLGLCKSESRSENALQFRELFRECFVAPKALFSELGCFPGVRKRGRWNGVASDVFRFLPFLPCFLSLSDFFRFSHFLSFVPFLSVFPFFPVYLFLFFFVFFFFSVFVFFSFFFSGLRFFYLFFSVFFHFFPSFSVSFLFPFLPFSVSLSEKTGETPFARPLLRNPFAVPGLRNKFPAKRLNCRCRSGLPELIGGSFFTYS